MEFDDETFEMDAYYLRDEISHRERFTTQVKNLVRYTPAVDFGYVYLLQEGWLDRYKIGVANDVIDRALHLQIGNSHKLHIRKLFVIKYCGRYLKYKSIEASLHEYFYEYRIHGEWYNLSLPQFITITKDWLREKFPEIEFDDSVSFEDEMGQSYLVDLIRYVIETENYKIENDEYHFSSELLDEFTQKHNINNILSKNLRAKFKHRKIMVDDKVTSESLYIDIDDVLIEHLEEAEEIFEFKRKKVETEKIKIKKVAENIALFLIEKLKNINYKLIDYKNTPGLAIDVNPLGSKFKQKFVKYVTCIYGESVIYDTNYLVRYSSNEIKRSLIMDPQCEFVQRCSLTK